MNARQARFCDEYLIDLNATQAAIRAGYSEKTAYSLGQRLLKNAEVSETISRQLEQMKSQKIADAKEVMEYLTAVARGESEAQVVVIENIGDYRSRARLIMKKPDEKERLKAAELLGKRYGLFTDKLDVQGLVQITFEDDYGGESECSAR